MPPCVGARRPLAKGSYAMKKVLALALGLGVVWSLSAASAGQGKDEKKEGKVVTTKSGLKYEDLKTGDGQEAKAGDTVSVHYTGWLKDGKKFDSSHDRKKPFDFPL